jgi:uncharacterized protein YndB with AHSA1/START domain
MKGDIAMARVEASVVINRPVDEVFAYVIDVTNWPHWTGFPEAEQTSEGPLGVGTTCRGVSEFMGRRDEWTSEVTAYEPSKRVEQKIIWGPMSMEQTLTFEALEGGTRYTQVGEGETGGIFKVAAPIVNRTMRKQLEGSLAKLKEILEAGA